MQCCQFKFYFSLNVVQDFFRLVQHLRSAAVNSLLRLTRRVLSADWGVQAQARAHALLPGALLALTFFNFGPDTGEGFASELAHLDVKQCRNDRNQRHYEDVCQINNLLKSLRGN